MHRKRWCWHRGRNARETREHAVSAGVSVCEVVDDEVVEFRVEGVHAAGGGGVLRAWYISV